MMLLTVPQAAQRLGISERRVRKLLSEHRMEAIYVGRRWLIWEDDCHYERYPQGNFAKHRKVKRMLSNRK